MSDVPACRFCGAGLQHTFVDLGMSPLCQTQIRPDQLNLMEPFYPLRVHVCESCLLVQLEEYVAPERIFGADYPYYSSYSDSWVEHARRYVEHVVRDFEITDDDLVVELASNDGYLLQHFQSLGLRCLGIEPAKGVADAAAQRGVRTLNLFFGETAAQSLRQQEGGARLIIGNNVLAHVPDLRGFVAGVAHWLSDDGIATFEFPHLMKLMELNQFDTIYHEHFSYFSFSTVREVFAHFGLRVFDVRELPTHGGSLRVYVCRTSCTRYAENDRVADLIARERDSGYHELDTYLAFSERVVACKNALLRFLLDARDVGKVVVGYGAPGKGNTLLNYCGIRTDLLQYTVDRSPHKQGTFTPGMRIPIYDPSRILATQPDYVLVLPWNLADEIRQQMADIAAWGGRFVVPIPRVEVLG